MVKNNGMNKDDFTYFCMLRHSEARITEINFLLEKLDPDPQNFFKMRHSEHQEPQRIPNFLEMLNAGPYIKETETL